MQPDEVIISHQKVQITNPLDFTDEILKKGIALDSLGKQKEALNLYNEVLNADSKNLEAYILKGDALLKLEMYLEAIGCCDKALQYFPSNINILNIKGLAFRSLKLYAEAFNCFNHAIFIDTMNLKTFINRDILSNKDQAIHYLNKDSIKKLFQVMIQQFQLIENQLCHIDQKTLLQSNNYEQALKYYDYSIELDPNDICSFQGTIQFNDHVIKKEAANYYVHYDIKIKLYHNSFMGMLTINFQVRIALLKLRHYDEAIVSLNQGINQNPLDQEAYIGKGLALNWGINNFFIKGNSLKQTLNYKQIVTLNLKLLNIMIKHYYQNHIQIVSLITRVQNNLKQFKRTFTKIQLFIS